MSLFMSSCPNLVSRLLRVERDPEGPDWSVPEAVSW